MPNDDITWLKRSFNKGEITFNFQLLTMNIELLSPAKTADIGIEAILHGADAVYIGAAEFGARKEAGNSLEDIERLVNFAHIYGARVYVTVNTIIKDAEISSVERLITNLYNIGVDALIVQDFGILKMNIPPIALHASTQMHNLTPEKVKFLEDMGFSQVVVARECSVEDIAKIREATTVPLEAFVHGARCVSYSGRCYASAALTGRSANRGECAQICRLPFQLQDAHGHNLGTHNYLSIKDMDRSGEIEEMINAGVSSFKIEGRLKDVDYVKNITAYYRKQIDKVLEKHADWERSSDGVSEISFTPNKFKSFFRLYDITTPKSVGEYVGRVNSEERMVNSEERNKKNFFVNVVSGVELHNGDGFCFFDESGEFFGFRANKVCKLSDAENLWSVETLESLNVKNGVKLFRNYDIQFQTMLSKPTATRRIGVRVELKDKTLTIDDGVDKVSETVEIESQVAKNDQTDAIMRQLSKLGETPFVATEVTVDSQWFFPMSALSNARRSVVSKLILLRQNRTVASREIFSIRNFDAVYPQNSADYSENVANSLAKKFYSEHGVSEIADAFEIKNPHGSVPVMFCKHCVRRAIGACKRENTAKSRELAEPLHLIYKNYYLRLEFDCNNCIMKVISEK